MHQGAAADPRPAVVPRLAATVALLRDGPDGPEVLLTQRPATMAFGPRLHVFPGGALDPEDADPVLLPRLRPPTGGDPAGLHGAPFVVAAIREAWEEAGVLLASAARPNARPGPPGVPDPAGTAGSSFRDLVLERDLELRGDWLAPLSRWVTPPVVPRRFDARFFVAWLPDGAVPAFDPREVAGHDWMTPAAALEAMADGRIELWMPTSATLQQLAGVATLADVARTGTRRPQPAPVLAAVEGAGGAVTRVTVGGAGGIPGERGDTYLVGYQRLLIIDPGDPNDDAADAILEFVAARGSTVGAVLVTSPLPERAAGAEGMALRLGVPLLAAAEARRVLAAEIAAVAPGDSIDAADVAVRVVAATRPVGGPGFGPGATLAFEIPALGLTLSGGADVERR
jgi:8-oxo-dGTP pyrophosphatase MutT (NUDIX family)